MGAVPGLQDAQASEVAEVARAVLDDIRARRTTDHVNDFRRMLANDPALPRAVRERLQVVLAPGALAPLVKEMIYVAVAAATGCRCCVQSQTAAARAKGRTEAQHGELLVVIGMAAQTDALVTALGVEGNGVFLKSPVFWAAGRVNACKGGKSGGGRGAGRARSFRAPGGRVTSGSICTEPPCLP